MLHVDKFVQVQNGFAVDVSKKYTKIPTWVLNFLFVHCSRLHTIIYVEPLLLSNMMHFCDFKSCLKVKDLEEKLANAKNVQQTPTDVEIELEHRLNQLTEHLIQKQAQVEELSTEKATLVFRLETLSNLLQDQGSPLASHSTNRKKAGVSDWSSMDEDLEYGASKFYSSKYKVSTNNRDDLHRNVLTKALINPHMLDGFYRRIDSLFLGGAHILRMHKLARALAGFYLLALHCWVLFILLMHSNSSREGSSIANSSTVLNSADSINVLNATRAS
ncbi:hypothetical protein O6H91_11G015500 [Diphasiastrum complanatum]|uniref:Uncharacterized protein n=1 Tax=Diphasiastrum complanatum TaxID=34168 RepID=A0ACC2C6M6_DIPCM|nr:hypothetical protein O6H91_11G015500 [Diphasiastrum complanatum]